MPRALVDVRGVRLTPCIPYTILFEYIDVMHSYMHPILMFTHTHTIDQRVALHTYRRPVLHLVNVVCKAQLDTN